MPQYVCIKQFPPSFKVKILESSLQLAIDSGSGVARSLVLAGHLLYA